MTDILDAEQMTALLVTHDQGEALPSPTKGGDRWRAHREQAGPPKSLTPCRHRAKWRFIGEGSFRTRDFALGEMTVERFLWRGHAALIEARTPVEVERIEILIRLEDRHCRRVTRARTSACRATATWFFVDLMVALDDGQQLHWHCR